ncbi:MAG: glycosyl hydrolase family 18 protein [Spirochaetota bacterium]
MAILLVLISGCSSLTGVSHKQQLSTKLSAQNPYQIANSLEFHEVWAYLMKGEEDRIKGSETITDLCYFRAKVSGKGQIVGDYVPPDVVIKNKIRHHIVIAVLDNFALMHFVLNPDLPYRKHFINDICKAASKFDGVQIDFESVADSDAVWFFNFLGELRAALDKSKVLSVALPPRRTRIADAYDYPSIAAIVDRVIIMAYDQHWSGSKPGPLAGLTWCKEVAEFAKSFIPKEKLIMGLPLYGRSWQDKNFNKSVHYKHVKEMIKISNVQPHYDPENGAYFEFEEKIKVRVYFMDERAIFDRLKLYSSMSIDNIAFWRIGQGPAGMWQAISTKSL